LTVSSSAIEVVRRRQNAGDGKARGAEIDLSRSWRWLRAEAGYLFSDSRFATGPRLPQVPLHQGSTQLTVSRGRTSAAAGLRATSAQFEDDLNRDLLPGYAVVHFLVRQRFTEGLSAQLAVENLLDREYYAGKRPTPLLAAPLLWRIGLRWEGSVR
jgi:outer membrane receptor protein involved in Fe transport